MFVWLGSGRAKRRKVEHSGLMLDRAARAGLPVPDGAILLDEFFRVCLEEKLVKVSDGRVVILDAELLFNTLLFSVRLPQFRRPVVLRPCFSTDPCPGPMSEGPQYNRKPVDFMDREALMEMLGAVWSGIVQHVPAHRADVLILETVAAGTTGQAVTCSGKTTDWVTVRSGEAAAGARFELPQLTGWRMAEPSVPPFIQRLQMLLRGVRRTFGKGNWALEWADDGSVCYLVDVKPCPGPLPQL